MADQLNRRVTVDIEDVYLEVQRLREELREAVKILKAVRKLQLKDE